MNNNKHRRPQISDSLRRLSLSDMEALEHLRCKSTTPAHLVTRAIKRETPIEAVVAMVVL